MRQDEALVEFLRRLMSDPSVHLELHGRRLYLGGFLELSFDELSLLPGHVRDPLVASQVEQLRAKITSLERTIEHLNEDRSTAWSKDAAKLADRVATHVEELSRLMADHP